MELCDFPDSFRSLYCIHTTIRIFALGRALPGYPRFSALRYDSLRCCALHCAPTIRCATLRSSTVLRYNAILNNTLRYASLRYTVLRYASLRYTALLYASLRYTALLYASLRYTALLYAFLRYTALRCASLVLCTTLGYPVLFSTRFYSINCKLTTGRMDVETNEGCDDLATYSK